MVYPFALTTSQGNGLEFANRLKQGVFLVVDDFDSMRKVTINQLKQLGAVKFIEAANGAEALKVLARQPVTMVLSDWNMPVVSGLELLLSIRSNPKLFALPFVMITAEAERDRVMLAIRSGVSELLVKPYTAARLAERIEKALNWKPRGNKPIDPANVLAGSSLRLAVNGKEMSGNDSCTVLADSKATEPLVTGRPATSGLSGKPTILIVDDTPDNLTVLSRLFKDDYRVKIAHNGEKALSICHSDTPPDLILLDIMMPHMDGFEVAKRLRGHPSSEHIPVIFVTAMTGDDARLKGMELGAVDFVTKPVNPDGLRIRVRNFMRYVELHRRQQADLDEMMRAERLKDDVASITRHDMKAPLAGVIGIIQSLADADNLTAEQRHLIQLAEESALQTLDMVNLSNELYKMETGRFVLDPKPVKVVEIIRRVVELQRKAFAAKNLTISIQTPRGSSDEALLASGDAMLCYSLFQNLMKNACEAAPCATAVTTTIQVADRLIVSIENSGVVPPEIRERFFEKFVTAGKQSGTGLGTYSAKLLVEAQRGSIVMETSDSDDSTKISVGLLRA